MLAIPPNQISNLSIKIDDLTCISNIYTIIIALSVVGRSMKKLFAIDCVDIYALSIFLADFGRWESVGLIHDQNMKYLWENKIIY